MIRISTIFIGICMMLIAASLGMVLYGAAGVGAMEAVIVTFAAWTILILYNAVSLRLRDRGRDAGGQIAELSKGTVDLARQVAEFGRRLAIVEGKVVSANSAAQDRAQAAMSEIGELAVLVRQLAGSVATHDDALAALSPVAPQPLAMPPLASPGQAAAAARPEAAVRSDTQLQAAVRRAVEAGRIDIHLQPIVTLPQRKVRFYEAMSRLRDDNDALLAADSFIAAAETAGLMGRIDHAMMLRCMQVLRRLMVRNKEVGIFCNMAAATLRSPEAFAPCFDFLQANRALAASFVLEFRQATLRGLGPAETERLATLARRGFGFSIDNVTDLRIEPRELAALGVRYIKVPAALLLDARRAAAADIDAADLSDLLGRFGIDLIAERIEGERAVVDLLDYDVRFGQGFLFAPPRPLRPDAASASDAGQSLAPIPPVKAADDTPQDVNAPALPADAGREPQRAVGNAALARRF